MNIYKPKIRWSPQGKELKPKGIVVHAMMESFNGVTAWDFLNENLGLSAHAFIAEDTFLFEDKDGRISKEFGGLVPKNPVLIEGQNDGLVAYHAGKSKWKDLDNLNNHFLGVEILVNKTPYVKELKRRNISDPYSQFLFIINNIDWLQAKTFDLLVNWCVEKMKKFDIPIENVVLHSDVSGDDVRGEGKGKRDAGDKFPRYEFYKRLENPIGISYQVL